ncbi:hypothetical protein RDABS01_002663 [Bienertia sinuspersici]
MYWKQRAKIKWDLLGDQCTNFFFRSVKTRKGKNTITLLKKEDGTWLRDEKEISDCFRSNYSQLFNPDKINQMDLENYEEWFTELPKLKEEDYNLLLQPFHREEIKEAVWDMKPLKAPGPDGFPPVFYHKHWDLVREDIWGAVNSFFTGGKLLKEVNKTFITLIPKVERPETINDFRPISLCNTVYKIISKCLVRRLKRVLPNLVGENQNAFVPGRQITDNCLLANEMLHLLKTRKKGRKFLAVLKVDLSKAYDRIRWDFLEKVLVNMNFPAVWVGWLMECVSTVRYAILVNGSPTPEFSPTAGLRQGDPLSPYLFILCMEALSRRMEKLQRENSLRGIAVTRNSERISHLFFADDALFSFEATPESCYGVRRTLEDFCAISGEMINYKKSHIQFSRNTPPKFIRFMRKPLGVRSQEKMGSYLGCPMDVDGRTTSTFNQIHDRVLQCISSWKYSCLNPAARSILINSVLVALAAHIMSIYLLPHKTLNRISSTILKFYWGGKGQARPIYWKSRDQLELRKEEGGLGLRNLENLNKALLFRQVWRVSRNHNSLASRVIRRKYGGDPLAIARRGATLRNASWAMRSMVNCAKTLKLGCGIKVGNGRSTLIQEDIWAGKEPIAFRNRDFENQPEKPEYVSDIIDGQSWNANKVWNWFKRDSAQRILSTYLPKEEKEDEIIWCQEENGDYSVKSGYWYLQNQRKRGRNHTETKFWKRLWKTPMSQRWRMFCWKLAHNALPTKENLSKRKITQNSSCVICGNVESASHLFLYCEVSKRIWSGSSLGLNIPESPRLEISTWFKNFFNYLTEEGSNPNPGWALLIANLWAIWTHRNNVIFREAAVNPYGVMEVAKVEMERWYYGFGSKGPEDRMQGIEEGRGPCTIHWEHGSPQHCENYLQIDGAWKNRENIGIRAACGWVFIRENHTKRTGSSKIFALSPLQAEAHSLQMGITVAKAEVDVLQVSTDSERLIQMLGNPKSAPVDCAHILSEILCVLKQFSFCRVCKVSRSQVREAHNLAVQARREPV